MEKINVQRRNFLKWLGFGVGAFIAFVLGKIFGPSINLSPRPLKIGNETLFKNFRLVETDEEIKMYNRTGDEIFIIEKEPVNTSE